MFMDLSKRCSSSSTFDEIWYEEDLLYGNLMIAHNASFDAGVLRSCLDYYGIFKPKTEYSAAYRLPKILEKFDSYGLKPCQLS